MVGDDDGSFDAVAPKAPTPKTKMSDEEVRVSVEVGRCWKCQGPADWSWSPEDESKYFIDCPVDGEFAFTTTTELRTWYERAAVLSSAAQAIREAKAEALIEAADEMQRLLDEWEATKLVGARHELGTILAAKQDIKFLRDRAGGL